MTSLLQVLTLTVLTHLLRNELSTAAFVMATELTVCTHTPQRSDYSTQSKQGGAASCIYEMLLVEEPLTWSYGKNTNQF